MSKDPAGLGPLAAGFYAWIVTVLFGAVLLDIVYAWLLKDALGVSDRAAVFSDVSDVLLRIAFVTVLASIGAVAASWRSAAARNLFIASLLFLAFEIFLPVFAAPFIETVERLNLGPWLRTIPTGLASTLALAGLYNFQRGK